MMQRLTVDMSAAPSALSHVARSEVCHRCNRRRGLHRFPHDQCPSTDSAYERVWHPDETFVSSGHHPEDRSAMALRSMMFIEANLVHGCIPAWRRAEVSEGATRWAYWGNRAPEYSGRTPEASA